MVEKIDFLFVLVLNLLIIFVVCVCMVEILVGFVKLVSIKYLCVLNVLMFLGVSELFVEYFD